uniref:Galectin n=1 Tax=Ditylenchus dipsaci TaxID=166011 RepID=A0A915DYN8_9BILA
MTTDYSWDNNARIGEEEHEDAYYKAHNNECLGEGEHGEVSAQVNMITPEVVAQAPEVLDQFAGAPVELNMAQGGVNQPEDMTNLEKNPEEPLADHFQQMALETNYPIPYRSKLVEAFEPGQTLIVKGKTAEDSVRFTINLHTASADFSGNDVPLHISVRFDEGKIVFNSFSKGEWGKEERKSNPYKKGDDIDLRIRAHDSKFTIFADQKEIKEYEHRVPLSSISHFSIDGDVFITHIHWGGKYYPVPYESGIPEMKRKENAPHQSAQEEWRYCSPLHPRFDEKAIVRNSLISNEWGNEEREGKIPLKKASALTSRSSMRNMLSKYSSTRSVSALMLTA